MRSNSKAIMEGAVDYAAASAWLLELPSGLLKGATGLTLWLGGWGGDGRRAEGSTLLPSSRSPARSPAMLRCTRYARASTRCCGRAVACAVVPYLALLTPPNTPRRHTHTSVHAH
jgi:hypothetical protein